MRGVAVCVPPGSSAWEGPERLTGLKAQRSSIIKESQPGADERRGGGGEAERHGGSGTLTGVMCVTTSSEETKVPSRTRRSRRKE